MPNFEDVYAEYFDKMVLHFKCNGYEENLAQDMAQDLFMKILTKDKLKYFDPTRAKMITFLQACANDIMSEYGRKRKQAHLEDKQWSKKLDRFNIEEFVLDKIDYEDSLKQTKTDLQKQIADDLSKGMKGIDIAVKHGCSTKTVTRVKQTFDQRDK